MSLEVLPWRTTHKACIRVLLLTVGEVTFVRTYGARADSGTVRRRAGQELEPVYRRRDVLSEALGFVEVERRVPLEIDSATLPAAF